MNQDNMDDKIKDIFGSLNEQDLSVAQKRKEHVWSMIQVDKKEKKSNQWWLLLLLGGLLFTAGWFLSPNQVKQSAPLNKKIPKQSDPDVGLQLALNKAKSFLNSQQKSLDSLQALNASLADRLFAVSQNDNLLAIKQREENQKVIRDTIFLTEVKVEQRIIEKVIRDTIILEVPSNEATEPMADVGKDIPEKKIGEEPNKSIPTLPSSVQFNFSETNHLDK